MIGIIYIDGPDAAGKTTLANYFVKNYGARYIHCTYRFKNAMFTYHLAVMRRAVKLAQKSLVIIDRHWLSEDIYARVYRGGSKWPHEGRFMDRLMLTYSVLNIVCLADEGKAQARMEDTSKVRHELYTNGMDKVAELYREYIMGCDRVVDPKLNTYAHQIAMLGGILPHRTITYTIDRDGKDIADYCANAVKKLQEFRSNQYGPALYKDIHNFIGHISDAKYLLVGDTVNHDNYKKCWPFMQYANSSLFITECLAKINFCEDYAIWTNANCPESHINDIIAMKPNIKVIALGTQASAYLNDINVNHTRINHPSFARRFNKDYVSELKSVLQ